MNLASSKISLYIHIPFCSSKCKYCDFYSETVGFHRINNLITMLIAQLSNRFEKYGSPVIETIFIGGGTPSILPNSELRRLLEYVSTIAPTAIEWTIESNPESITEEFLKTIDLYGVNRLSIGVQSFNNDLLKTIGRKATREQIDSALGLVKKNWTHPFSLDLISSLPGQTVNMVENDIKEALKYKPDHISFYALSIEEGTPLEDEVSKGIIEELTENISENIWLKGRTILNNSGYNNYEVSNYTIDSPSIHNSNYWELKPYLGIGPGAVSTLINEKGEIVRVQNKKSITEFLKGPDSLWGETLEVLTAKNLFEDYIIMGLRLKKGINRSRFSRIFHTDIKYTIPILNDLIDEDLIVLTDDFLSLTDHGFDIMNSILIRILDSIDNIKIEKADWFY